MSKEKVQQKLTEYTAELSEVRLSDELTTEAISEAVSIRRNTTSQYLNELVKSGLAFKVKTRPAIFFDTKVFSEKFFAPTQAIYESFEQLLKESKMLCAKQEDVFKGVIGAHSSLKMAVDQIKTAAHYPGIGLPVMLHGATGVGKSMLARKAFEYCVSTGLIKEDAPFIELNCAQYYHNQELLSSILFGYKKGAFTGAADNNMGVLEAAAGGVLFLDECHRLSPESQEKLFTFMDTQRFSRWGENQQSREAQVRLIFATTEDISKNFLRTFMRRVPISITIPNLYQRTRQEIYEYLYTFFIRESHKLNKEIVITPWIMNRLIASNYQDNVGELKNLIKIICARAFSQHPTQNRLIINSSVLEDTILSRFLSLNEIDTTEKQDILVTPDSLLEDFLHTDNKEITMIKGIYKVFEEVFQLFKENKIDEKDVIKQLAREATTVIETLVYDTNEENHTLKLLRNTIKELVNFLETNFYVKITGNSIVAITSYLYKRNDFFAEFPNFPPKIRELIEEFINIHLLTEKKILNALLELIESKLDLTVSESEKILLAFYLKGLGLEVSKPEVRSVILAHGFSTASSIADVVNHFMKEHLYDSFDMPFNMSLDKVQEYMHHYLKNNDCSKGLVILADMGSLMALSETLKSELTGPLLIINNVTTQQALYTADLLKKKTDFQIITERLQENMSTEYKVIYPDQKKQPLIITVCHTGLGAAQQLKEFLETSLPEEINYTVEAVDYQYLKKYGKENSLFKQFNVQGIVGTANPGIADTCYVSLEDLVSGQGQVNIDQLFSDVADDNLRKEINNNLVKNMSIERLLSAITILDVKRVISYIEETITEIERKLKINLSNGKKAILYVHIASLVERMIRNSEITEYHDEIDAARKEPIQVISESLEGIEKAYSIQISVSELNYLYDIIYDI